MHTSRIKDFHKLAVSDRLLQLVEQGFLSRTDLQKFQVSEALLNIEQANSMSENVLAVFSLPYGVALNFKINGREYVIPMVVEEPSVIAAVSGAAKLARQTGGFKSVCKDSLLMGQIQIVGLQDLDFAAGLVEERRLELLNFANTIHPRLSARGGGVRELRTKCIAANEQHAGMLIVEIYVETCDAMGANLVNTICEGLAPKVAEITDGEVVLRILSNLCDRSLVSAEVTIVCDKLSCQGFTGERLRDRIVFASDFAAADPYRAATHNKGIMNGIDAVALATGNDWRAIEAGAHAYAGSGGSYRPLSAWSVTADGDLKGELTIPIKVGSVGAQVELHPLVRLSHKILGIHSAKELAEVMAAVGLAQNLAALKALAGEGISRGHLALHARSVALAAGTTPELMEPVVERLIDSGQIKIWKANEIVKELRSGPKHLDSIPWVQGEGTACGKVILLGEHAVLYGAHAIVSAIPETVHCRVNSASSTEIEFESQRLPLFSGMQVNSLCLAFEHVLRKLALDGHSIQIQLASQIPPGKGLGFSAAAVVAFIRALIDAGLAKITQMEILKLAHSAEELIHGHSSGVDPAVVVHGGLLLFKSPDSIRPIVPARQLQLQIAFGQGSRLTKTAIERVLSKLQHDRATSERIFNEIDALSLEAAEAIELGELTVLARCMHRNQQLLAELGVSDLASEALIMQLHEAGALAAKITGAGDGGAVVALLPERTPTQSVNYCASVTSAWLMVPSPLRSY